MSEKDGAEKKQPPPTSTTTQNDDADESEEGQRQQQQQQVQSSASSGVESDSASLQQQNNEKSDVVSSSNRDDEEEKNVARLPQQVDHRESDDQDTKIAAASTSSAATRPGAVAVGPDSSATLLTRPTSSKAPPSASSTADYQTAEAATPPFVAAVSATASVMSVSSSNTTGKETSQENVQQNESAQTSASEQSEQPRSLGTDASASDGAVSEVDDTAMNSLHLDSRIPVQESQVPQRDIEDNVRPQSYSRPVVSEVSSSLPVAEEYNQSDFISAELVAPPMQAEQVEVFHVDIDGDPNQQQRQGLSSFNIKTSGGDDGSCRRRRRTLWLIPATIIAGIILAVSKIRDDRAQKRKGIPAAAPPYMQPTSSPTFPYECYTSMLDLLTAQIELDEAYLSENPLIVCPNTTIAIGVPSNPSRDTWDYISGDYPIQVIRKNVTIQCGLDGRRENNCVLSGGLVQVISQNEHWHPSYGFVSPTDTTDNLLIIGFTFTGRISGSGPLLGIGGVFSTPGRGMRFEDCAWVNMTASHRVFAVGQNHIMHLQGIRIPDLSVELTFSNCLFEDVTYNEEFFTAFNQTIHIDDCQFRNIKFSNILSDGCSVHPEGCRNFLYCQGGPNVCTMSNVCVENFDVAGAGPIVVSNETEWINYGNNTWYGPVEAARFAQGKDSFCALGVARLDSNEASYVCLEPTFEQGTSGGCPRF